MVPPDGHSNAALSVMYAEVAGIMGRPMLSDEIQVSPPNHQVALLNWWSLTLMLTETTGHQTGSFPGVCCGRTASTGGPGAHSG